MVAKYDTPESKKVVLLTPLAGMVDKIPMEAYQDEEFKAVLSVLMNICEHNKNLTNQGKTR